MAFSLAELLVVVAIVTVLIGFLVPVLGRARRAANTLVCASNMRQIGLAMTMYANRNRGTFPYAEWETDWNNQFITWDDLLNNDLGGNFTWDDMTAVGAPREVPVLICPEHEFHRVRRRSYSMIRILGSVGSNGHLNFLGFGDQMILPTYPPPPASSLSRVSLRINEVRRPSETLSIVECHNQYNSVGNDTCVFINAPRAQWDHFERTDRTPHGDKWNYLFVDGHVATLRVEETLKPQNGVYDLLHPNGAWTRDPND